MAVAVALALALALLGMVWLLARPLALLFSAVVIANALSPVVDRLARRMPRGAAVAVVYVLLVLAVATLLSLLVPPLINEAAQVVVGAPQFAERAQTALERVNTLLDERWVDAASAWVSSFGGRLVQLPFLIFSAALEIALVFVMSLYWLLSAPSLHRFTLSLLPPHRVASVDTTLREMGQTMGGYVRGVVLSGLVLGVLAYLGLLALGMPYALVLALVAGAGELIPILGPLIASVPAIAVGLSQSPEKALAVAVFYLALQQIESNVLTPHIMQRQAHVPPLLVTIAIFAGGSVGNILGALVAIPLAGALRVVAMRVLAPMARRASGAARE